MNQISYVGWPLRIAWSGLAMVMFGLPAALSAAVGRWDVAITLIACGVGLAFAAISTITVASRGWEPDRIRRILITAFVLFPTIPLACLIWSDDPQGTFTALFFGGLFTSLGYVWLLVAIRRARKAAPAAGGGEDLNRGGDG